jgi:hypothetical protein
MRQVNCAHSTTSKLLLEYVMGGESIPNLASGIIEAAAAVIYGQWESETAAQNLASNCRSSRRNSSVIIPGGEIRAEAESSGTVL